MKEKYPWYKNKLIITVMGGMLLSFSYYLFVPMYIKHKARSSEFRGTVTGITENWILTHRRKMPQVYHLSDGSNIYENVFFRNEDLVIRGDSVYKAAGAAELQLYKKQNGTWVLYGKYTINN